MSQPRPDASWPRGRPGLSRSGPARNTANPWAAGRIDAPVAGRPWEVAGPPADPGVGGEWPPDAVKRDPSAERDPAAERGLPAEHDPYAEPDTDRERGPAGGRAPVALTGRGAVAGMLVLFFFILLIASWLQWGVLAGASFVIGSVGAAWYTKRRDLLTVTVSPPLLFFFALICVKALTAKGSAIISTVEGTALTLANVAPWLFAGVVLSLIVAWVRGLPQCVADLRRELRPDLARPRPGSSRATASRARSRPGSRRAR
ncbi:MAG: hypothetical protein JWL68_5446 [Actinomycetia bacterium]|nr:hypothetical protein [Actinomycetes bacterium]